MWAWDVQKLAVAPESRGWVNSMLASTRGAYVSASVAIAIRTGTLGDYERHGTANDGLDSTFWVPSGTMPGLSNDHHLSIIDLVTGRTHDMHGVQLDGAGRITGWNGGCSYPTSPTPAYVPRIVKPGANTTTNASNVPCDPSAITPADVASGCAARTLRFPCNKPGPGTPRYPAAPFAKPYPGIATNPPLGTIFRLPLNARLPSIATPFERCIFRTLQVHGAVLTDGGSNITFKAADLGGGGRSARAWAEVGVVLDPSNGGLLRPLGGVARMTYLPLDQLQALAPPAH